jgi:tRNA(Ile)-lysidine synthase
MLKSTSISRLQNSNNLLAFSAGVDSSALFFILLDNNIKFDIAIVDYNLRGQSKEEVKYAIDLAKKYKIKCHLHTTKKIEKNLEANARKIRYNFFDKIIKEYDYNSLITAHHLGDRFEWMLMQFCKGAGCVEIAGMKEIEQKDTYSLIRPLLHIDKQELITYLEQNNIKYFNDHTNFDENIKRNSFRHKYSNPLLKNNLDGIRKSFQYIDEDREKLIKDVEIKTINDFAYFKSTNDIRSDIYAIDKYIKSCNLMMSANEKKLLKENSTTIIGRKFIVNQDYRGFTFILPYTQEISTIPKEFKDECRKLKIEPKIRQFLSKNIEIFDKLKELL